MRPNAVSTLMTCVNTAVKYPPFLLAHTNERISPIIKNPVAFIEYISGRAAREKNSCTKLTMEKLYRIDDSTTVIGNASSFLKYRLAKLMGACLKMASTTNAQTTRSMHDIAKAPSIL